MQEQKYEELETRAALSAEPEEKELLRKLSLLESLGKALTLSDEELSLRQRIHEEIEGMRAEGKALTLSDEEFSMLESFRRFKLRMRKDGEVFTWQTRKPEGVQLVEETANILHPNEAGS